MKARLCLLALAIACASTATLAQQATPKKAEPVVCDKNSCQLTVTATACDGKGVTVTPDVVKMKKGNKDAKLTWTLKDSAGFAFATGGIFFKDEEKAKKDFVDRKKVSGTEFEMKNKNVTAGSFKYGVKLTKDGKDCPPFDPEFINDP